MNAQESQLLNDFLNQLVQVKGVVKDREADGMISRALAQQPDAAYLLVQRALLQEQALEAAKRQIAALQSQLQERQADDGKKNTARTSYAQGQHCAMPATPTTTPTTFPSAPPHFAAQRPGLFGGGMGSFLGTAAATAAGVAGGAFLFQGLENLLGNHGAGLPSQHGLSDPASGNALANHDFRDDASLADNGLAADAGLDDIGNPGQFSNADDLTGADSLGSMDDLGSTDDFGGADDSTV